KKISHLRLILLYEELIMDKKMTIWQGDITTLKVDAILNAANKSLLGSAGVDGAIHQTAGPELLHATKKIVDAKTGETNITKGFKLLNRFIIHIVGPIYKNGFNNEAQLLAKYYKNSLALAQKHHLKTIAFSANSTGVYGYPLAEDTEICVF